MAIELPADVKQRCFAALQAYCREHLECDPGLLQTQRLYDMLIGVIGAAIYNQAITDAQAWMSSRLIDLEGDLHETMQFEPRPS